MTESTADKGDKYASSAEGLNQSYQLSMRLQVIDIDNFMAPVPYSIAWFLKHPSSSPSSIFSRGLVSSLRTPMHRSITLNQPDNLIQRGN